jgi:hypothetical protein
MDKNTSSPGYANARRGLRLDSGALRRVSASLGLLALSGLVLSMLASGASAFPQYSVNRDATNCRECHGDFRASPYISRADGQSWGSNLHDVHRLTMLGGDCDTCHTAGGRFPVRLDSSAGGTGLDPISCAGCHGRAEDGTGVGAEGYGAGLRQHHWIAGVTTCVDCHADADPVAFTPADEDVLPPYYSNSDAAHPDMPGDPCNIGTDGFLEDYAATTLGLDNDGDDLYDEADLIPCPEPGSKMMLASGLGLLLLFGRTRRNGV